MKQLVHIVGISCVLFAGACKKKDAGGGGGSGSDMARSAGSDMAGSAATGSAAAGSGSAIAGSAAAAAGSAAAGSAGAGASACVDGAYKDPNGVYCVKLPEGYAPPPTSKKDEYSSTDRFMAADETMLTVNVYKSSAMTWDNMKGTMVQQTGGNKPSESTELDGGNAYWVTIHLVADKQTRVDYAIKAGDKVIQCVALFNDKTPLKPLDACKSLKAM